MQVNQPPSPDLTGGRLAPASGAPFTFACPACGALLAPAASGLAWLCPQDGELYRREAGIWRFLLPERQAYYRQFTREYETVRQAEGRGSPDPAYYRALPFVDLTGRRSADWRIRARSYQVFIDSFLRPYEAGRSRPLAILDAGAGNGWLSYRLAQRGHRVAALDLLSNAADGLGAHALYDAPFTPVQAEFDRLPFTGGQFDLVVFNASFHYAADYGNTLRAALRVLEPAGRLVLLDSPVYRDPTSGEQMVRQREAEFERQFGFPSNALPSQNFLTYRALGDLAARLDLSWQMIAPFYGVRWALRPLKAKLLGRREPARFLLIVGSREYGFTKVS
jgi:SAM-dependent methyltransferase